MGGPIHSICMYVCMYFVFMGGPIHSICMYVCILCLWAGPYTASVCMYVCMYFVFMGGPIYSICMYVFCVYGWAHAQHLYVCMLCLWIDPWTASVCMYVFVGGLMHSALINAHIQTNNTCIITLLEGKHNHVHNHVVRRRCEKECGWREIPLCMYVTNPFVHSAD